jgi:hypothetical protein
MTTTRDSRTRCLHRNPSPDLLHREESDHRPIIDSEWFPMMIALTHMDDLLENEIGHCPQAHARETIEEFSGLLMAERMINHAYLGRVLERASAIGGIALDTVLATFTSSDGQDVLVDLLEHRVALDGVARPDPLGQVRISLTTCSPARRASGPGVVRRAGDRHELAPTLPAVLPVEHTRGTQLWRRSG